MHLNRGSTSPPFVNGQGGEALTGGFTKEVFLQNMDKIKELILVSDATPITRMQLMNTLLSALKKLKNPQAQYEVTQSFNCNNVVLNFIK